MIIVSWEIFTKHLIKLSLHDQEEFLKYFKMWIKDYSDARGLEDIILPDNFVELVDILYKRLNDESGIGVEIRTSNISFES